MILDHDVEFGSSVNYHYEIVECKNQGSTDEYVVLNLVDNDQESSEFVIEISFDFGRFSRII